VEETIFFAARLKTPKETSDSEVQSLVENVMEVLGLSHIRDNLIGSTVAIQPGISGGERKRTAVAAELVSRPSLLLLDEPTSGLDATTAHSLMSTLKELASVGHAIAVVIHQPRTDIFKLLDHLLLLSKGKVVYDGPADCARRYLEAIPSVGDLPAETGIADWIMDSIIQDQAYKEKAVLTSHWKEHGAKYLEVCSDKISSKRPPQLTRGMSTLSELKEQPKRYEASFMNQLRLLAARTLKQRRGEKFTRVALLLTSAYVFFTSYFWWQMPDTTSRIFERNSLLFFMLIAQGNSIVVGSISVFQRDRALLRRERAKKLYGVMPFFLANTASDMSTNIVLPMIYGIIVYFAAGLRLEAAAFFKFVLAYYLTLSCAQSMGFFMSILFPNMQMALLLAPSITLFFFIMGGFYIPLVNMHWGIKWASYVSFCRYGYGAMLLTEYEDRLIPCADDVAISIGGSDECPLPGETVYENLGFEGIFTNYLFNIFVLALLNIFFLTAAYFMLRRSKLLSGHPNSCEFNGETIG
jgi:ABC-type multidrug transport system ATPase subunit/ABC-type multidrug transport system permease subunit